MMLSVRDLKVTFRTHEGLVRAIDGVSFDLNEGEILGVVGESGPAPSPNTCNSMWRGFSRYFSM